MFINWNGIRVEIPDYDDGPCIRFYGPVIERYIDSPAADLVSGWWYLSIN